MKRIIGILMLSMLFGGGYVAAGLDIGFIPATIIIFALAALVVFVKIAVWLINGNNE